MAVRFEELKILQLAEKIADEVRKIEDVALFTPEDIEFLTTLPAT